MFSTEKLNESDKYEEINIDERVFYKKIIDVEPIKKKRRYSDTLKDPSFLEKDLYRKLNMIKNFRQKNGDLYLLTEKWKEVINYCIITLQKEYGIMPSEIFKCFDLTRYGFLFDDYEQ